MRGNPRLWGRIARMPKASMAVQAKAFVAARCGTQYRSDEHVIAKIIECALEQNSAFAAANFVVVVHAPK